ncbi:MAG: sigma-54-dependent Fis family transcriptional regulator [Deltaproteobacteria bacterium]|nr:sigma-54-dependent Fis family transcriptional regulator [Deltaproteobacteria bacterium]
MGSAKILVVDDDKNLLELLRMRLEAAENEVAAALSEKDALAQAQAQLFDLAIVDLKLHDHDGLALMEELHALSPEMPVIILTAHGSIESAVEAMKRGACSYVTKPFDPRELLLQVDRALENRRLTSEVRRLRGLLEERYSFANIVAKSERMQRVLEVVSRIAKTDSTVYIHGESGTGKELIAKAVHVASTRENQPFVAINCAALPEALLESELFGHEKGAFTGAIRSTKGLFTQAHRGTIFLDEIGDMSPALQAKLLRALQERQFYPVGSDRPVAVDVRVIVATKRDLEEEVKQGLFREDLFYRIHVIPIHLPPLKDRKEDIPPLVEHFIERFSQQMKKGVKALTQPAMRKLMLHQWPGNVRELENTIEYAVAMTQQDVIGEELILPAHLERLLEISKGNVSQAAKLAGKYRADFYDLLRKHGLKADDFKSLK